MTQSTENQSDEQPYMVHFGGAVKALGENRIGGRVVTFSGARDPDRSPLRDYFDGSTDFWLNGSGERRPILYRHGLDPDLKKRRFGEVQIHKAADGIWAQGFFNGKDPDSLKLLSMAQAGQLNWSTGSVGHLVSRSPVGDANHVDEWPISEVSLCPDDMVCEPRNVVSLKSLITGNEIDFHSLKVSERVESEGDRLAREHLQQRASAALAEFERVSGYAVASRKAEEAYQRFCNSRAEFEYKRLQQIIGDAGHKRLNEGIDQNGNWTLNCGIRRRH